MTDSSWEFPFFSTEHWNPRLTRHAGIGNQCSPHSEYMSLAISEPAFFTLFSSTPSSNNTYPYVQLLYSIVQFFTAYKNIVQYVKIKYCILCSHYLCTCQTAFIFFQCSLFILWSLTLFYLMIGTRILKYNTMQTVLIVLQIIEY